MSQEFVFEWFFHMERSYASEVEEAKAVTEIRICGAHPSSQFL
jgi:hypothetical protein